MRGASGLSGAQCHGLVGPKIPIDGVPSAAATWSRPESFDTATSAAASPRIALRKSAPVRSRTWPCPAPISAASAVSPGPPSTITENPCATSLLAVAANWLAGQRLGGPTPPGRKGGEGGPRGEPKALAPRRDLAGRHLEFGQRISGRQRRAFRQRQRGAAIDHARQ